MISKKKLATFTAMTALCLSFTVPVFAKTQNNYKDAGNYGTLSGSLSALEKSATVVAWINRNPDRANLTITFDAQTSAGKTVGSLPLTKSGRGEIQFRKEIKWEKAATVFHATCGVQDGATNPADYVTITMRL